jgi:putative colanic acid biosynthesis acetyltransferase WcaF
VTHEPAPDQTHTAEESAANSALTRKTPWTLKQNIARTVWMTFGRVLWLGLPRQRSRLIRLFGGRVGKNCVFGSSVEVTIPWHVDIGDNVRIRSAAVIYSLGEIRIGHDCVLDARAHLCAGTHDMSDPSFPLVRMPITIGNRCFLGIDTYVGPGVELGDDCRVWPRTSVYKSEPAGTALRGNPARVIDPASAAAEERAAVDDEIEHQRQQRLHESPEPA